MDKPNQRIGALLAAKRLLCSGLSLSLLAMLLLPGVTLGRQDLDNTVLRSHCKTYYESDYGFKSAGACISLVQGGGNLFEYQCDMQGGTFESDWDLPFGPIPADGHAEMACTWFGLTVPEWEAVITPGNFTFPNGWGYPGVWGGAAAYSADVDPDYYVVYLLDD